jgi:uracil-DNA glycosylase family 4
MSGPARLEAIAAEIRAHRGCGFEPCETCTNPVPGEGDPRAAIAFVGEAPGRQEDAQGRPFVGGAGRLLDELLASVDLERADVFITNVLKARPPGNRDPRAGEIAHSWPWLSEQLELVRPRIVVPLGRHALGCFVPGTTITATRGTLQRVSGWAFYPMLHPAAALRARDLRAGMFEDVAGLRDALAAVPRRPRARLAVCPAAARAAAAQARTSGKP